MQLGDILIQKGGEVVTVGPGALLVDAIALLNERRIGALLVRSASAGWREGRASPSFEGIVTERDVLRACHERRGVLTGLAVRDVMTHELVLGRIDDTIARAMAVMTERRIRHLPVVDGPVLAGLVSIGDLVSAALSQADLEVRMLYEYVGGCFPWRPR